MNSKRDDNWVFGDGRTGIYMLKFQWHPIERHILVIGNSSPDDPSLKDYWRKRKRLPEKDLIGSDKKLSNAQKGLCPYCKESLFNGEELHRHHRTPRKAEGKDTYANLELAHLYCHQKVHAELAEITRQERERIRLRMGMSEDQATSLWGQ